MSAPTKTCPSPNVQRWQLVGFCLLLAVITFTVFGQTAGFGFVNYDDNVYVYENAQVTGGLSWRGLAWVFTHADCNLYHPLTMLSLMADYQIHGRHIGGYHLTNVLLHTASVFLLFLVLHQMTGALWRSAFVAAVFAIHPLRAESVAWVAERKDVLGGFFFMLTLAAYVHYVRKPNSLARYLMVAVAFVLALLSKPTVVTLPFVLLLLDYWPLRRTGSVKRLVLEKIPLLALAIVACAMTILAEGEAIASNATLSLPARVGNAVISYAVYLRQMVWPAGLTPFYPQAEQGNPAWAIAGSFFLLALITGTVLVFRRTRPWLVTGWLWYLGMLAPMSGLVQVGSFAHADRMTYLPQIGLYISLTWVAAGLFAGWHYRRTVLGGLAAALLAVLIVCARTQTAGWRDGKALWNHTLACDPNNFVAHNNVGVVLIGEGQADDAIFHFRTAMKINSNYEAAPNNLGIALMQKGETNEAISAFQIALKIKPDYAEAHNNLGSVLRQTGQFDEAIAHFKKALQINPNYATAYFDLGSTLVEKGRTNDANAQTAQGIAELKTGLRLQPDDIQTQKTLAEDLLKMGKAAEAIPYYQALVQAEPQDAHAHFALGWACLMAKQPEEALTNYQAAVRLAPDVPQCLNALAWIYATSPKAGIRNGAEAMRLATRACEITKRRSAAMLDTLAAACAETGRFDDAIKTTEEIRALAIAAHDTRMAATSQQRMALYKAGKPYRDE